MKKGVAVLVVFILLLPTLFVLAQDSTASTLEITGANASDLPTITITTNVLDSSNRPVAGLSEADFTLTGSLGAVAEIVRVENITSDNLPFATVLVIDVSSSMSGLPLREAQIAARQFVESIADNDPVAIVTFGNTARLVLDYSTDKDLLLRTIDNLSFGGRTALYDAAVLGIEVAADAPVPRRAVILLSDGAEFGGLSRNQRAAAVESALSNGVTVYTIGLGFGIDRSYLQELSAGTNARNYESPTPDELTMIYGELADLFRSQYVLTLNAPNIALDGTEYDFALQVGQSNAASSVIRAPIPVPIVNLPDSLFAQAITEVTTVTPEILADDDIVSVEVLLDGNIVNLDENGSFIIDPVDFAPRTYTLAARAIDVDGDSSTDEGMFEIGAIASNVSFNQTFGDEALTETQIVTLTTSGQTPIVNAVYGVLNDSVTDIAPATTDADNGFPFILDPFNYEAGIYTLRADVTNEGGITSTATQSIIIGSAVPRGVTVTGITDGTEITEPVTIGIDATTQPGANITSIQVLLPDGTDISDDLIIYPSQLAPGDTDLTVTITDSNGSSSTETVTVTIGALPPEIQIGAISNVISSTVTTTVEAHSQTPITAVSYRFDDDETVSVSAFGSSITIDPAVLGDGQHTMTATVTNEAGLTATTERVFTVVNPTPTFTPSPTVDEPATAAVIATLDAQATLDAESALNALATSDAVSTSDAIVQATSDTIVQATSDTQATADSQAAIDAQATVDSQATNDANVQATTNAENTATAKEEATVNAQGTLDIEATTNAQMETAQADVNRQETIEANATTIADEFAAQEAASTVTSEAEDALATVNAQATVDAEATLESNTVNLQATSDAQATIDAQAVLDNEATSDAQATIDAQAVLDSEATSDAQATVDAEGTVNPQSTADAQATVDAQATNDTVATEDAIATAAEGTRIAELQASEEASEEPSEEPIIEPTLTPPDEATVTAIEEAEPTETFEATFTSAPTLTPIGDIVEEDPADSPPSSGPNFLLIGVGILALVVILFFILRRGG
ncbi:MAG: VWA domain-containing protein [Anaerolineae bacterium]|nr:VWA domain-containing protein [Anaerolineae bacterium]